MNSFKLGIKLAFLMIGCLSLYAALYGAKMLQRGIRRAVLPVRGVPCQGRIVGILQWQAEVPADPREPNTGYSTIQGQAVYEYIAPSGKTHRGNVDPVARLRPWKVGNRLTGLVDPRDHNSALIASCHSYVSMLGDGLGGVLLVVLPVVLWCGLWRVN